MAPDSTGKVAAILNAAWMVRHYARGATQRNSKLAELRARAIRELGLVVRDALNQSEDYEALLAALVDGLRPRDEAPPF